MDMNTIEARIRTTDPGQWREGDAWLAGGTVLFSRGSQTLRRLLDLDSAGWTPLTLTEDGLEIAATCTIAELYAYGDPAHPARAGRPALELVRQCCESFVASFKIWNMSTVGGNIATALPAGPMTSLAAALDGEAVLWGPGGAVRTLPVADLVTGNGTTALAPGELIRAIRLPAAALASRTAFRRLSLSNLGRSGVLVIGRRMDGGGVRLTVTASTRRPVQLDVPATHGSGDLAAALEAAIPPGLYHDDLHGHPRWRRDMTHLLAEQVRRELRPAGP